MHSHLAEFREGGIVEFSVVLCSCARRLSPLFPLFSLLLLLGSGGRFFLRGLLLLVWFPFECRFQITDAQFSPIQIRVPIERSGLYRAILAIPSVDSVQDERAIFHRPANGSQLVHAPRKRHRSRSRYEAERGPESRASAARGWRGNRTKRFGPDAERHTSRRSGRGGTCGRAARTLIRVPWISRYATEPDVALRQSAEG